MTCAAFWKHTNIRSGDRIFPCCRFKYPIAVFDGNLSNVLHIPEYQRLREQTDPDPGCAKCYHEESCGIESMRQRFNNEYNTDTVELKYLEIGFDNICNLYCNHCSEEFSSTWAQKNSKVSKKQSYIISNRPVINIPQTIERIVFLGGEPLMTTKHKKFLESLKYLDRVSLTYNTNGTYLLDDSTISLLKQFKEVKFIISIDGYGGDNEAVRPGSNWNNIEKFIKQVSECGFNFSVHTTLYKDNYKFLPNLSKWIMHNKYDWSLNLVTYPPHLDIVNLSTLQKQELLSLLTNDIPNKQYIINHLK